MSDSDTVAILNTLSMIDQVDMRFVVYRALGYPDFIYNDDDSRIRRYGYIYNGWPIDACNDDDIKIRELAYTIYRWPEEARSDAHEKIRAQAYAYHEWPSDAINDKSAYVRMRAYENLGWPRETLKDKSMAVRRPAYNILGHDVNALNDRSKAIVDDATYALYRIPWAISWRHNRNNPNILNFSDSLREFVSNMDKSSNRFFDSVAVFVNTYINR